MSDLERADRERMTALARELDAMASSAEVIAETRHRDGHTGSAAWWYQRATELRSSAAHVRDELAARGSSEVV